MAKKIDKDSRISLIATFLALLVIGITTLVISGKFGSIVTTIIKPQAAAVNPKVTQSFVDQFKTNEINSEKWNTNKSSGVTIVQTSGDNLKFTIPKSSDNKTKTGQITFKQTFDQEVDFRTTAVLYRPVVSDDGVGLTGLRFASTGGEDDESAVIQWKVSTPSARSKVSFTVRSANGTKLDTMEKDLNTNIAVFKLQRIDRTYQAFYKVGRDVTSDTGWTKLGEITSESLGKDGHIALFANNTGSGNKYPRVMARYDSIRIEWEGEPRPEATKTGFEDAFANGVLATRWSVSQQTGTSAKETARDNLSLSVSADSKQMIRVTRKEPSVGPSKGFTFTANMYKPKLNANGLGFSGISFNSATNLNDEAAQVRWETGTNRNRLVFLVRAPDGSLKEFDKVSIEEKVAKLNIRLTRRIVNGKGVYGGWYRIGDGDADWKRIGREADVTFNANGKLSLFTNNGGQTPYVQVVGRFDRVTGSVDK